MLQSTLDNYNPKCSLYLKKRKNGADKWWMTYYLPNNFRVNRPCHAKKSEAKRLLHLKEKELLAWIFDEKDLEKQPDLKKEDSAEPQQLLILEAMELYLTTTAGDKQVQSHYVDQKVLEKTLGMLVSQGVESVESVKPLDIQKVINRLNGEGKAEATLKTYARILKKFWNWLDENGNRRNEKSSEKMQNSQKKWRGSRCNPNRRRNSSIAFSTACRKKSDADTHC